MPNNGTLEKEIIFLGKLGLQYIPFVEGKETGMLFEEDRLVGYVIKEDNGDLVTQIDGDNMSAHYCFYSECTDCIMREISIISKKGNRRIELRNISKENSEYLDFEMYDYEHYKRSASIEFSKGRISCGRSSINQYIELNGEWFKGKHGMVSKIIEEFRRICPNLINYYIEVYGDNPKVKQLI